MNKGSSCFCVAFAAVIVGSGLYQIHLGSIASPKRVAVAAMTSPCAQAMLVEEKPRGMLRSVKFSRDNAWTVGDLKVVHDMCADQAIVKTQIAAARSAVNGG